MKNAYVDALAVRQVACSIQGLSLHFGLQEVSLLKIKFLCPGSAKADIGCKLLVYGRISTALSTEKPRFSTSYCALDLIEGPSQKPRSTMFIPARLTFNQESERIGQPNFFSKVQCRQESASLCFLMAMTLVTLILLHFTNTPPTLKRRLVSGPCSWTESLETGQKATK